MDSATVKSYKDGDHVTLRSVEDLEQHLAEQRRFVRRRRRIFHFTILTFLISLFAFSTFRPQDEPLFPWFRCGGLQAITPAKTPVPCGITLEKCTRWDGHDEDGTEDKTPVRRIRKLNEQPVSSYAEFAYPANTTHLFIISRGGFSVGSFHVEAEDEDSKIAEQAKGDLKIEVEMIYKDEKFLDQAKVCKVQRRSKDGSVERGLGIFTPQFAGCRPQRRRDNPFFKATLKVPQGVKLPLLDEDLPLFGLEDAAVGKPSEGRIVDMGHLWR